MNVIECFQGTNLILPSFYVIVILSLRDLWGLELEYLCYRNFLLKGFVGLGPRIFML